MKLKSYFILSLYFFLTGFSVPLRAQETTINEDFQKGMVSYNDGQYQEALNHFQDAVNENPDSWQSYQMEGYCDYYLGNRDEMVYVINESLKLHPDNPILTAFIKRQTGQPLRAYNNLGNPQPTPTPLQPLSVPVNPLLSNETSPYIPIQQPATSVLYSMTTVANPLPYAYTPSVQYFDQMVHGEQFDLHLYTGLDVAFMDDIVNGFQNWTSYQKNFSNVANVTNTFSRVGFLGGLELKKDLGGQDLSINGEIVTGTGGESDISLTNGTIGKIIINPTLLDLNLNYTLHFAASGNIRPYAMLGLGYYQVSVQYSNPYATSPNSTPSGYYGQGTFNANTWGGTLGLGSEWVIDRSFTFDIAGRFRLATFGQLLSNNFTGSDAPPGTGPYTLEIYQNRLYFISQSALNASSNGSRYAVLDYSGVDLMIGLNFYFGGDSAPVANQSTAVENQIAAPQYQAAPATNQAAPTQYQGAPAENQVNENSDDVANEGAMHANPFAVQQATPTPDPEHAPPAKPVGAGEVY